jgi:hypothetical protein
MPPTKTVHNCLLKTVENLLVENLSKHVIKQKNAGKYMDIIFFFRFSTFTIFLACIQRLQNVLKLVKIRLMKRPT